MNGKIYQQNHNFSKNTISCSIVSRYLGIFLGRPCVRKVGQGLIAGRKQLGPVKVVKPSLRGVTGSVTCKSQRQVARGRERERVPVAALGKAAEGVMDITGM